MSDILNHYYCGELALEQIDAEIKNIILKNRTLFDLGTQGPDFFLYHGAAPWRKNRGYGKYGGLIHKSETDRLIYNMLKHIDSIDDKTSKEKAISYAMGFVCHLSLDSISHPFIFYYSGVYTKGDKATEIHAHLHKEYEMILDALNSKRLGKIRSVYFPYRETFTPDPQNTEIIQQLYESLIEELTGENLPENAVSICIDDFMDLFSIFPDRSGIKKKLLGVLERIAGHPHAITKALIQKEFDDKDDYLNLKHGEWVHPCYKTIKSTESYVDLFDMAVKDAAKKINQLFKLIDSDFSIDDVAEIIHNVSFETGSVHNYVDGINRCEMKHCSVKKF
ncbi:Zinc dependent phospholipase C [Dethiosulfatibacter aminovorans DSM 17477]|uniref:Zinc dependent phospholipase C n=1 Tax=Dethiosulfatibacter aminovorans DSM 17477 TaxID=1121476 RepID=A0A1M6KQ00_9FIRM|nr:zinc dependent phospholipase C family protein [Dethiosulfatibacter aminovorans]SHJ60981.1 Zinc dependent phospholipase C [Dethiosulfatibacter aminovorans DSM 17477]